MIQTRENWRRGLEHVERLVRNREVDCGEGAELFATAALGIMFPIQDIEDAEIADIRERREQFIRNVAPAIYRLERNGQLGMLPPIDHVFDGRYVWVPSTDFRRFSLDSTTGRFQQIEEPTSENEWHWQGGQSGRLVELEERILYVGTHRWLYFDPKTGERTVLVSNRRQLPDDHYGDWQITRSNHYGLVAWKESVRAEHVMCQVRIRQAATSEDGNPAKPQVER